MSIFKWGIAAVLAVGAMFTPAREASAQQWIFCDTCSSAGSFENAAINAARAKGRDGRFLYSVGNPNSEQMRHVDVRISKIDMDPWFVPDTPYLNAYDDGQGEQAIFSGKSEMTASGAGDSAVSAPPTAAEAQSFQSALRLSKNAILVRYPPSLTGHQSYTQVRPEYLGPMLHAQMTAKFPGWFTASISLKSLLTRLFGNPPHACVVFSNGDSACYTFDDIRDPDTVVYIKGTAQDSDGEPLPESDSGVGIGSGLGSGKPVPMGPVGDSTLSWRAGGSAYLICGYIGGKLTGCYVQIL